MKIFFGRSNFFTCTIDRMFSAYLRESGYKTEIALNKLKKYLMNLDPNDKLYTCNPVILQYGNLDEYVWFIDDTGKEIHAISDPSIQEKLSIMGLGEALIDDDRILKD